MSATTVSVKTLRSVRRPVHQIEPIRRRSTWWRGSIFRKRREPTTFHKCLALHMHVAERIGALD
jgi:hypothetical protein